MHERFRKPLTHSHSLDLAAVSAMFFTAPSSYTSFVNRDKTELPANPSASLHWVDPRFQNTFSAANCVSLVPPIGHSILSWY